MFNLIAALLVEAKPMEFIPHTMIKRVKDVVSKSDWTLDEIAKGNLKGENTATAFHLTICKTIDDGDLIATSEFTNGKGNKTFEIKNEQTGKVVWSKQFKDDDFDSFLTVLSAAIRI